ATKLPSVSTRLVPLTAWRKPSTISGHAAPKEAYLMSHTTDFIHDALQILTQIDVQTIDRMVGMLVKLRERAGRLFILGVGGSAANAAHMVNDFRKIAQIETYAPTDNVAELTARVNDEGWETVF